MKNIFPQNTLVSRKDRTKIKNHESCVLWFTGFSGSGKSTIANRVEERLNKEYEIHTYLLDGDNIRSGLNTDLGFSESDRVENIRRIGEVCKLFYDAGLIVLTAFISPFVADRNFVRSSLPENSFIEIFVDCPLEVCEKRDPKGLYSKVRKGEIKEFTGIDSPYQAPLSPEVIINSATLSIEECSDQVIKYLVNTHKLGK
ncbi:MAG: adenylyl-sulfate kinase [Bacteroidetes bacterium]|jgi:adenylylsulfate kinase|nr:adenylyl-sulfate kinase [Chloroflexota bacterium]MBT6834784.1 adenylyl-sulfate kinase [Bacteroidota bacterium]MBT4002493.1 adenylyl-sulfate kinase [Chloroflexota bacterium]MBT4306220.1 adenylyl-sulfate kinase [Chloroflexota bacterium]MBT4534991.1 adenylyl-sulfate kinase [Chloroflexota bacterium]